MIKYSCQAQDIRTTSSNRAITPTNGVISWHIDEKYITKDVSKTELVEAVRRAFAFWQPCFTRIGLRLDSTSDIKKAPIIIRFGNNGDNHLPENFGNGVLAYAFFPFKGSTVSTYADMYFNDARDWLEIGASGAGIELLRVVIHEIGHALGLYHSTNPKDILYATYNASIPIWISPDTFEGVKTLYGQFSEDPVEPAPPVVPVCKTTDAIVAAVKDKVYRWSGPTTQFKISENTTDIQLRNTLISKISAIEKYIKARYRTNTVEFKTQAARTGYRGVTVNGKLIYISQSDCTVDIRSGGNTY